MTRDFVILFSAREGSSALIDLLGRHPDIRVPIFEQLDEAMAHSLCDRAGVARLLDLTFATGDFEAAQHLFITGAEPSPHRPFPVVGCKWRLWGEPQAVAETFARRGMAVFHLYRLKLREVVTSIMFTDVVLPELRRGGADLPEGHLQFEMSSMDAASRAAVRARLAALRFRLDPADFTERARIWLRSKTNMVTSYIQPMQQCGVKVHCLLYEDFSDNQALLVRKLCAAIGVDPAPLAEGISLYARVHEGILTHQVENWAEINASRELTDIVARWHLLITENYDPLEAIA